MKAKHVSVCAHCNSKIRPGQEIAGLGTNLATGGPWMHAACKAEYDRIRPVAEETRRAMFMRGVALGMEYSGPGIPTRVAGTRAEFLAWAFEDGLISEQQHADLKRFYSATLGSDLFR